MPVPAAKPPRPVILCVLDGWGERAERADNAIAQAEIPVWRRLIARSPHGVLEASEHHVGLPDGQMGNSEVGHMNLGAGRIVMQDLPRIDTALADGSLAGHPALADFIAKLKASGGSCHLMGLVSPGGVHSHQDHLAGLARLVADAGVPVAIHAFLDGRDTPPKSAAGYMKDFVAALGGRSNIRIATISGRFFAMDRDKRWDRVAQAFACVQDGKGKPGGRDPVATIEAAYAAGESDEFVTPSVMDSYAGMRDGDGLVMGNFRADRAREILSALLDPAFSGFARERTVRFAAALGMAEYSSELNRFMATLFPPAALDSTFGAVLAASGKTQLRIAETEKYAHVTFFFNGGEERQFQGEERILVPSPKVKTYDMQPEMSAYEVTDKLVAAIQSGRFDFILVNFANTDMVGHTGDLQAAIKAVEAVDRCLGRLEQAVVAAGGVMLITADHGNAETMRDAATHEPHTAHTTNLVPSLLVNAPAEIGALKHGSLADVAPTLLALMGIAQPAEMTGRSLLEPARERRAG